MCEDGAEAERASFREQINQRAAPRLGKLSNDVLQSCSIVKSKDEM